MIEYAVQVCENQAFTIAVLAVSVSLDHGDFALLQILEHVLVTQIVARQHTHNVFDSGVGSSHDQSSLHLFRNVGAKLLYLVHFTLNVGRAVW